MSSIGEEEEVEITRRMSSGALGPSDYIEDFSNEFYSTASMTHLLSPLGYNLCIAAFVLIMLLGTIGNLLVLFLIYKNKSLRTPLNMLLVNMGLCDLFMTAIGSPFPLISAFYKEWIFGNLMCKIYGFGMAFGGIGNITTLMVLAFERFLMISRPFKIRPIEMKQIWGIIGAIWIYTACLTLPPLFGWASYDFEGPRISCSIGWEAGDKLTQSYIIFLFFWGLVVPVLTISFSYFQIIRTVKKASGEQGRVVSRAEAHVVIMIAVMITGFIIAWMPYAIVSLLVTFGIVVSPGIAIIPAMVAKSASCYNPIIYVGLNTQFQSAWRKMIGCKNGGDGEGAERGGSIELSLTNNSQLRNLEN